MSFDDVKKACESWIKTEPQYRLLDVDESAGKLVFLFGDKSFYCTTPEHNNGNWVSISWWLILDAFTILTCEF